MLGHLLAVWYFIDTHFTFPGSCCSYLGCSPCQFSAHPNHSAFQSPVQMPFSSLLVIVSPPRAFEFYLMLPLAFHITGIRACNCQSQQETRSSHWTKFLACGLIYSMCWTKGWVQQLSCNFLWDWRRGGRSTHGLKWDRKWDCDYRWRRALGRIVLYGLFLCCCEQTLWPRQLMDRVLLEFTILESTVAREASLQRADRLTSWKLSHRKRREETEMSNAKLALSEVLPSAKWHFSNSLRQCYQLGAKWSKPLAYWRGEGAGGGGCFSFKPPHALITQRH